MRGRFLVELTSAQIDGGTTIIDGQQIQTQVSLARAGSDNRNPSGSASIAN